MESYKIIEKEPDGLKEVMSQLRTAKIGNKIYEDAFNKMWAKARGYKIRLDEVEREVQELKLNQKAQAAKDMADDAKSMNEFCKQQMERTQQLFDVAMSAHKDRINDLEKELE